MGYLTNWTYAIVSAVNNTGRIAVGHGDTTKGVIRAFRWQKDGTPEMENLGVPDGYDESRAEDLNNTGSIIVGFCHKVAGDVDAFCWDDTGGSLRIEQLPKPQGSARNSLCLAHGTNSDGTIIVGSCKLENGYTHAVYWQGDKSKREVLNSPMPWSQW